MQKITDLTIVIIAKNEAENLSNLLPLLNFSEKVVVVDHQSTDETKKVAENLGATCCPSEVDSFAQIRNQALKEVKTKWVFYLDADERVTPELANEIATAIKDEQISALTLKRENICYGFHLQHGGWERDLVTRIFRLSDLKGWQGDIHESPQFSGSQKVLKSPLIHLTHRCTADNLHKSAAWTLKEAQLFIAAKQPPITKKIIIRKTLMEFYRRYWQQKGYRDGMAGFVESFVQAFNRGLVYIQVWELQQQPSLESKYAQEETRIAKLWQAGL
ncbi:MAG: glycosyltransferase family 2 protein [bacterium]|nr:glycosyltransferase family 2 protein [bacterium]